MSDPTIDDRQQVIADLQAARAELAKRGRLRRTLYSVDTGQVCALGAIGLATVPYFREEPWYPTLANSSRACRAISALAEHTDTSEFDGDEQMQVAAFSDDATTDQDVLDLFDKALADLGGLA